MESWMKEKRRELKELYEACASTEQNDLKAFSGYLFRILSGMVQMAGSQLYDYELQILEKPMKLFCEHYIRQVQFALDKNTDLDETTEIIRDIELAITRISNVYKNVIDSTANSDRQMFTSQAVETNLYDLSPKLITTYSAILETLVSLYGKKEEYAFLLHPSLKRNIEVTNLFDKRDETGKVVLIYIPESSIEKMGQIPIYLLHEAFHVLTKTERCRKQRAKAMETHMSNAMYQQIFKDVDFNGISVFASEEERDSFPINEKIKKALMEKWFRVPQRETLKKIQEMPEEDRRFYSKNLSKEICDNWREWVSKIFESLGRDLYVVLEYFGVKAESSTYTKMLECERKIHDNLIEILANNLVKKFESAYMSVYRESYADIACILASGISPAQYDQAFLSTEITASDKLLKQDKMKALRIYVVAQAIGKLDGVDHRDEWVKFSQEHVFSTIDEGPGSEEDGGKEQCDSIVIYESDINVFQKIMDECCNRLWAGWSTRGERYTKFKDAIQNLKIISALNEETIKKMKEIEK